MEQYYYYETIALLILFDNRGSVFFFRFSKFFYPLLARLDIGAGVEQPFGCLIVPNRQAV